jgi:hypothetical protein
MLQHRSCEVREIGYQNKEEKQMDNVTLVRLVAGALAVVVLFIIIWRRKRKIVE